MMNRYDAGELDVTTNMSQIPALMWIPISVDISSFNIRALGDSGKVYWQAWYV